MKNYGASVARNEIVIFLDSDVVPESGWLKALLGPFRAPHVHVVGGSSHLDLSRRTGRAFAAFWFFPPRAEDGPLADAGWFFANNVAFRRLTFLADPFPQMDVMRGQCTALAQRLVAKGVPIKRQLTARVSHPPPNGILHFVARALWDGRDLCGGARGRDSLRVLVKEIKESYGYILARKNVLALTAGDLGWAYLLCTTYQVTKVMGYALAALWPGWIERRFSI